MTSEIHSIQITPVYFQFPFFVCMSEKRDKGEEERREKERERREKERKRRESGEK